MFPMVRIGPGILELSLPKSHPARQLGQHRCIQVRKISSYRRLNRQNLQIHLRLRRSLREVPLPEQGMRNG